MDDPLDRVSDLENDPSAIAADLDADGTADVVMGDENRDGQADWVLRRESDGTSVAMVDTDASGSLETGFIDSDADGRFDEVTRDLDDDTVPDVRQLDSDGDGVFETMVLADDTMISLDPDTGLVTDVTRDDRTDDRDRDTSTTPVAPVSPTTTASPTTSAVTPASPAAQPATPAAAPVVNQAAAPVTSSTTVTPSPATFVPTPRTADPAPPPGPLVDDADSESAPPTTSSTDVHPGPPPPADGSDPSQTPWPDDQPGIGDDVVADEAAPATQTPWAPDQPGIGDDVVADEAAPATQTPWAPDQPGIGDDVVADGVSPGVPEPDPNAPADPAPQTPWPGDQPGIGDDAPPYVEPVAEAEPVIDLIHGDGDAEMQWGQIQTLNGYCGPVSIAMVLSELTGVHHGETQMVQAAIDRDILQGEPGAWEGMYVQDVAALLTEFGAASHVEYGTLDSLRAYLDQGRDIILFVDSSEVWYGTDDDGTAGDRQDHFLVITEIDDERGVATLNDPGWPSGVGREVSLSVIEDAWQDSSYQMVVTDSGVVYGRADVQSTTTGAADATGTATSDESSPHPGFVILPVVLSALALLPRPGADESTSPSRSK